MATFPVFLFSIYRIFDLFIHFYLYILEFRIKKNTSGFNQIDFGAERDTQGFYQLAKRIERILDIQFSKKTDHFNTLVWNYSYHGVPFVLCYHWDAGTYIRPQNAEPTPDDELKLEEIISILKVYL